MTLKTHSNSRHRSYLNLNLGYLVDLGGSFFYFSGLAFKNLAFDKTQEYPPLNHIISFISIDRAPNETSPEI